MMYVTDTHSLIWFITESSSLSSKVKEIFEKAEKGENIIVIPTIVLAEMIHISERKGFEESLNKIIHMVNTSTNYLIYDLEVAVVLECRSLIKIPEMHDRIITATARILKAKVLTKDKEIKDSNYIETIW